MNCFQAHLVRVGLRTRIAGQISALIQLWISSCGPEWTIKRLKSLKMYYLHGLAQMENDLPWFALDESGRPQGPFKHIWSLKNPSKILSALMVYTGIILRKETWSQKEKFFSSVASEPIPSRYIPYLKESCAELSFSWKRYTYKDYPFTGTKSVPALGKSLTNNIYTLGPEFRYSVVRDVVADHPEASSDFFADLYTVYENLPYNDSFYPYAGRISCIQERGGKARFIANPLLTLQCLTFSLGMNLFNLLRGVNWDCTFDQDKGVRWAREKIKHAKLFSVDIADFTNTFPRDLVYRCLSWLPIPQDHLAVFDTIVQLPWDGKRFDKGDVYWEKGMPLGLYPTFPAAALVHGLLLRSIEKRYGLSDTFRILGDDVIISNPLVHVIYRKYLREFRCLTAEDKCLYGKIGEFAGKTILEDVLQVRKIPSSPTLHKALSLVSIDQCKSPHDLLSYIYLLGLYTSNPDGLPLKSRAHLAYIFGLISSDNEKEIPTGPFDRNTLTLLLQIYPQSINELGRTPPKSQEEGKAWYDDFVSRHPDLAILSSHPSRMEWYASLIEPLPVFARVLSKASTVSVILKRAVERAVSLNQLSPEIRKLVLSQLEAEYLEWIYQIPSYVPSLGRYEKYLIYPKGSWMLNGSFQKNLKDFPKILWMR